MCFRSGSNSFCTLKRRLGEDLQLETGGEDVLLKMAVPTRAAPPVRDSVDEITAEIRALLEYVMSRPALMDGSASFMRDQIRTLHARSADLAQKEIESKKIEEDSMSLDDLSDSVCRRILDSVDGKQLALLGAVSRLETAS